MYIGSDIVRDGLILHLDAGSERSYPRTGTVWRDLSGNGNNGTLTNGPTFNSNNNGSIVFDGVNDFISTGLNISNPFTNSYTFSLFLRTNIITDAMVLSTGQSRSTSSNSRLYIGSHTVNGWSMGIQNSAWTVTNVPVTTNWTFVTLTMSGGVATLYVNSNAIQTKNYTSYTISGNVWLGAHDSATSFPYNGNISQAQIYNRAITPQEILQNYNATKKRFGL
jgi:hypothetical protein